MESAGYKKLKVALCVPTITSDTSKNLEALERQVIESSKNGVDLVVFAETVITGLANNDDPEHDIEFVQEIPGEYTNKLGMLAKRFGIHIAFGMLEDDNGKFYDSAVLLKPDGKIGLKYRRVSPHWHTRNADPNIYCEGDSFPKLETPFGSFGFLICGDMFDDKILKESKESNPDWLLYLVAISFPDDIKQTIKQEWESIESFEYMKQIKKSNTPTLMVNYLAHQNLPDDDSYGGAFVFTKNGDLAKSFPLQTDGILYAELTQTNDMQIKIL